MGKYLGKLFGNLCGTEMTLAGLTFLWIDAVCCFLIVKFARM